MTILDEVARVYPVKRPASFKLTGETIKGIARLAKLTSRSQAGVIEALVAAELERRQVSDLEEQVTALAARVAALEGRDG